MKLIQVLLVILAIFAFTAPCFADNPTNFTQGVTNVSERDAFGDVPQLDPTKLAVFFDDFVNYSATYWVPSTTEAGTGSASEAIQNTTPSSILITNATGDNDEDYLEYYKEIITCDYGKKTWFKAKFKVSDASEADCTIGLAIGTAASAIGTPRDGVVFHNTDNSETLNISCVKDGSSTSSTSAATLVDNTWIEVAFRWDGVSIIEYWIDGVKTGTLTVTGYVPDNEPLCPVFGYANGEVDEAKTMAVDYICVIQER